MNEWKQSKAVSRVIGKFPFFTFSLDLMIQHCDKL